MALTLRFLPRFPVQCSVTRETNLFQGRGRVAQRIQRSCDPSTYPTAVIRPSLPNLSWTPPFRLAGRTAVSASLLVPTTFRTEPQPPGPVLITW